MIRHGRLKFALGALTGTTALLVGIIVATQAAAVSGSLVVESATMAPGAQATVNVRANVPSPGLGAWTIDISVADPSHVSIVGCTADFGGLCNPNYPGQLPTVRIVGASANGLPGDGTLGTITLRCNSAGSSALNITAESFADATVDHPEPIATTIIPGTITCRGAAGPTSTPVVPSATSTGTAQPAATPTFPVRTLVNTGTGGTHQGDSTGWAIVALAGAGISAAAGYRVLRRHRA